MYTARAIGSDSGKEVPSTEANESILHLATVACEKNGASARPIANTENVTFLQASTERGTGKRVVMGLVPTGMVCYRVTIIAGESERGIGFCG
jgi:hypothetical protein